MRGWRAKPASHARNGFFEGWRDGRLTGWAHDAEGGARPAALILEIPGHGATALIADRFRADVQAAGFGNGICGFAGDLLHDAPAVASCRWADSGKHLSGSPWRAPAGGARRRRTGSVLTLLDPPIPGGRAFTGAVLDSTDPERRLLLTLVIDGLAVSRARACRYAGGLMPDGSDGLHGFRLAPPPQHGGARSIQIRETRSQTVLMNVGRKWVRTAGLA